MKRSLIAVAVVLALAVVVFVRSCSASADTPGCVSHAEYDSMDTYLSTGQVAGRFDTNGVYLGSGDDYWRRGYPTCWDNDLRVVVWYSLTSGLSDHWAVRAY